MLKKGYRLAHKGIHFLIQSYLSPSKFFLPPGNPSLLSSMLIKIGNSLLKRESFAILINVLITSEACVFEKLKTKK